MTFFLIFKDHPSGELWVTGSFTSERRFKLVPPTQLGKLQVKAGCWKHCYTCFLFFSLLAHQILKWSHCPKWMCPFLHLHCTSHQVKYLPNLPHVKSHVF